MFKKCLLFMFMISLFVIFAANHIVFAHGGEEFTVSGDAWMENYSLIITDARNINEAYQAADAISREGGHIGVIIPNKVMLGWVPQEKVKALVGKSQILSIHHKPVSDSSRKVFRRALSALSKNGFTEAEEKAIAFFNEVVGGDYKIIKSQEKAKMAVAKARPIMRPDAFTTPPISYRDYMANLAANGIAEQDLRKAGIFPVSSPSGDLVLSPGNSDYMVGKILLNIIFVESNGAINPNTYTWTDADRTTIQNEITSGLSWWSNTAYNFSTYRTPLTFVLVFRYSSFTTTGYEPILHPSSDDGLWISAIMSNFGYASGDKLARTAAFNTAQRLAYNTNWAATSFVAYNPSPAATTFTDGYFAYSYLKGPYSQLLFRNDGWGVSNYDIVNAHETGHLTGGASDEYYQAGYGGCTSCAYASNGVLNGNCEYCNTNSVLCMMKGNDLSLCGYTPGQIGWRGVQYLDVATYRTDNGDFKNFFAPGEAIQYKAYYCHAGPNWASAPTDAYHHRIRFLATYFGGTPNSSTSVNDDTGWSDTGPGSPPTSTGLQCWWVWWNRSVPATAINGPATLAVQVEITGQGKGALTGFSKFHVSENANTTQKSPLPATPLTEGPFFKPAPLPGER